MIIPNIAMHCRFNCSRDHTSVTTDISRLTRLVILVKHIHFSFEKKFEIVNYLVNTAAHIALHEWRTCDTPHRQLYGMSAFPQVIFQLKIFRSHSGLYLFLTLICSMACHLPVTRPTWNHLRNSEYFEWIFTYENIEFKIYTFLFTFKFTFIK